jgi:hypothetical protein
MRTPQRNRNKLDEMTVDKTCRKRLSREKSITQGDIHCVRDKGGVGAPRPMKIGTIASP